MSKVYNVRNYAHLNTGGSWLNAFLGAMNDMGPAYTVGSRDHLVGSNLFVPEGSYRIKGAQGLPIIRRVNMYGEGSGGIIDIASKLQFDNGSMGINVCTFNGYAPYPNGNGSMSTFRDFAVMHLDHLDREPPQGYFFPQWRPGKVVAAGEILVASHPLGSGPTNTQWGWAWKARGAFTTGADEPAWHDPGNPKNSPTLTAVADNGGLWDPVICNGFDVNSICKIEDVWIIGWPGCGRSYNCSNGYPVPNNCNNWSSFRVVTEGCGLELLIVGADSGTGLDIKADSRANRIGLWDESGTKCTYITRHMALNELCSMRNGKSDVLGTYMEGGYGPVVLSGQAEWIGGSFSEFHGNIRWTGVVNTGYPQIAYWQPDTVYPINRVVKPPIGSKTINGQAATDYWYKIYEDPPGNGTSIASVAITASNSGGDLLLSTVGAHGLTVGKRLVFVTTGTFPGGLVANTTYHVVSVPLTTTYKVSLTAGGAPVAWSSAGASSKHAVQPLWKGGIYCLGTGGFSPTGDTFGDIPDGTCTWVSYLLAEVSTGRWNIGTQGSDAAFVNRTDGQFFLAGGTQNQVACFGWGKSESSLSAEYHMVWSESLGTYCVTYNLASNALEFGTGVGSRLPPGKVGAAGGIYLGGGGAFANIVMADAVPANGTYVTGALVVHRDATSGQPALWQQNADGTYTVLLNKP